MSHSNQYFYELQDSFDVPQYWSKKLLNLLDIDDGRNRLDIANRNRALYHAVHLLNDDWQADSDKTWSFTEVKKLQINPKIDEQQLTAGFVVNLKAKLRQSQQETFASYDDFVAASTDKAFDNYEDYLAWQRYFFPYLVAGLGAKSAAQARAEAFARLGFFVAKLPGGEQDEIAADIKISGRRYIFDWLGR